MGDTGSMALGVTLGIVAMLTNTVLLLPVIGFVFMVETLSVIIQIASKKLRHGKKVFRVAPFHHHLEAIGWPEHKIVMRLWVVSGVTAVFGVIMALVDRGLT
jgi:phospho-N-acetylmuramoyl-pentapeptide-transferase